MSQVSGLIISETEPEKDNKYAWFKPSVNKYYTLNSSNEWEEAATVTISWANVADKPAGLTGSKTVGGYRLTFTDGLLTGFVAV